jgi:membrane carboxypeptidase/penicillin-binding protein
MRAVLAGQPREDWPGPPAGVTVVKINRNTGKLARENDPYAVREVFMAGTEPTETEEEQPGQEDWYQAPKQH